MADAVKLKQLKALDFANQAYAGSTDTVPDGKYAPEPVWRPQENQRCSDGSDIYDDVVDEMAPPASNANKAFLKNNGYDSATRPLSTKIQMDDDVYTDTEVPDDIDPDTPKFIAAILKIQNAIGRGYKRHQATVRTVLLCVFAVAYAAYFGYAMYYSLETEDSIRLLWITCVVVFFCVVKLISDTCGDRIYTACIAPVVAFVSNRFTIFKWAFILLVLGLYVAYIIVEVALSSPENLLSGVGYLVYVAMFFIFSASPAKVRWRPVLWGLGIQFFLGIIVLKTQFGFDAFQWLGERVSEFLQHTDAGSIFVFGESYLDHFFAFSVMPVVIFFSTIVSVLYYLGVMQFVILKIAWVMQKTLGTTVAESVNAAGNIFIGQTEAPLLIRPMINDMTTSELHAVMVGGFATIAGSVMATYILFGVAANHLICASVMAAPCALAMSKLSYPETQSSKLDASGKNINEVMEAAPQRNVIEAASAGASASIKLVANILACLIAFIALLEFVNATFTWFGDRVGLTPPDYPSLTFQLIMSYLLWPFAFIMGVATDDCRQVAELIGYKTFTNEFIAYERLGVLIENSEQFEAYNGSYIRINDDIFLEDINATLVGGVMQHRSIVISTYALCGFANLSSIGMVIGALGAMAPHKKSDISGIAFRAMVTGTVVSFMNACTAGLLYENSS